MLRSLLLFFILMVTGMIGNAQEVTASPNPIVIEQLDGTTISIIGKGNRYYHWTETLDGYSMVRNENKIYEYALLDPKTGKLIPSGRKAHDPKNRRRRERRFLRKKLEKHIKPLFKKVNHKRK